MRRPFPLLLMLCLALLRPGAAAHALVALEASFDTGADGFVYVDDRFRSTGEPAYADGQFDPAAGESGGGLRVVLGGIDGADISGMSGGFEASFTLATPEPLTLRFRYRLTQSATYESSEWSQAMAEVDGAAVGTGNAEFIAEVKGDGNSGPERSTGWRSFSVDLGELAAGPHGIAIGAYNNLKTLADELTTLQIDDVVVETTPAPAAKVSAQALVDALDRPRFEQNITTLVNFGSRHWSQQGNLDAVDWIQSELESYGYTVERHAYLFQGQLRENVYATKVGTTRPDEMYIVSAHMDSINLDDGDQSNSPGADDDASGTSLVLEIARVFGPASVTTDRSVRFVLWNNEETGLDGSEAYVADRRALQGIESPAGSGLYPEPTWIGVIQHDMILFDHGLPPGPQQIPDADIDVEYQSGADVIGGAIELATALHEANGSHATDHPTEVSANMNNTDSRSFQDDCPAVSVRENRRIAEIGQGANPHWHQLSDVPATFTSDDYRLGFNTVQTTTGAVAALAGAVVAGLCGNGVPDAGEACDDGNLTDGDGCSASCVVQQCSNGIDDDGDGGTDWDGAGTGIADPNCTGPNRLVETPPAPSCLVGLEGIAILLALGVYARRRAS